jgi:cytochrome c-type biogenesis protein CcmH/NrfF
MTPTAHIGHFLWTLYLLPVLIVIAGILRSTITERRRNRTNPPAPVPNARPREDD